MKKTTVSEIHAKPGQCDIRLGYFRRKSGTHTVALYWPFHEQEIPDCWNFERIEEARVKFAALRKWLASKGYVKQ